MRGHLSWRDAAIFAMLGVANNALYLGLGYTGLQIGLRRPRRPDRLGQSGVHRGARRAVPRRGADLAQGGWACCSASPASASSSGIACRSAPISLARHPVHAGLAGLDRRRHHPVQAARAEGQPLDRQRHPESRRRHRAAAVRVHASPMSATSCRARGCWVAFAFLVLGGSILAYSALVSSPESVWRDRRERLSFPDAAARHAVRLPRARRACRVPRPARDRSGRARHLSGDPSRGVSIARGARHEPLHHPDRRSHRADRDRRLPPAHRSDLRRARRLSIAACEAGEADRARDERRRDRRDRRGAAQPRPAFRQSRPFRPDVSRQGEARADDRGGRETARRSCRGLCALGQRPN